MGETQELGFFSGSVGHNPSLIPLLSKLTLMLISLLPETPPLKTYSTYLMNPLALEIPWVGRGYFPGGLAVKTVLPLQGVWVQSLVGELKLHMLRGTANK